MRRQAFWDNLLLIAGAALAAFAVNALIEPNRLGEGGVVGLALLLRYLTGAPTSWTYALLNVPLLLWAVRSQGWRFVARTAAGVGLITVFLHLLGPMRVELPDRLLAALYAGLVFGAGIGLMLRAGGSSGGIDIVAAWLFRRYNLPFHVTFLAADGLVLAGLAAFTGLPTALYTWIATAVSGRVVTYVVEGPRRGLLAIVITSDPTPLVETVMKVLGRGATLLRATGAYTGQERVAVLVALTAREVARLRQAVAAVDPRAFVIVTEAAEVLGEGFWELAGE